MWLKGLNSSQSHTNTRRGCRGSACHLAWVIFVKGATHAERKQHTNGTHYSGLLITFTCSFLFVVVISWRSEVYIVKICNKTRVHAWEHIYFYAPTSGPVKLKPHILPDHKVRTETSQSQPVLFVFVKMLTTWHNKGWVRNSVEDISAVVAFCVCVCVFVFVRTAQQRQWNKRDSAYLPGCAFCAISAATPATGHTVWSTCRCSRRRACGPSRRIAWVPAAGWSSARQA